MNYITGILIANITGYFLIAFVKWDYAWISDIAEWSKDERAWFLYGMIIFSLLGIGAVSSFWKKGE